jgi:hypothetical protein
MDHLRWLVQVVTSSRGAKTALVLWVSGTAVFGSLMVIGTSLVTVTGVRLEIGQFAISRVETRLVGPWVVFPYGLQEVPSALKKGQRIQLVVFGRVSLDSGRNIEAGQRLRHVLEERMPPADHDSIGSAHPPEDLLSATEVREFLEPATTGPWTGPEGYEPLTVISSMRASRRMLPWARLGALIGQFRGTDCSIEEGATFLIGDQVNVEVPCDSRLWVGVNEVIFEPAPWLFYQDNLGAFSLILETGR